MQRSYPLRWLALALSLLGTQCQDSLSDDCTKTLTCPDTVQPVLDENCIWRYPDDTIWTGAPAYDAEEQVWRWPDGTETATQTFNCTPLGVGVGDAGTDAGSATACRVNTDCDVPLVCDTVTSRCVECLTSAECADHVAVGDAGAAIACDQVRHVCVPCVSNENCSGDTPVCKTNATSSSRNECVQCTADADCGGDKPICDPASNECTLRCTSSAQCAGDKSVCNLTTQLCVECTDASTCSGSTSQCNTATSECVQCIDDVPCVGNGRVCDTTSNNCVQCVGDIQCQNVPEAPHCEADTNICVQCLTDQQCTNANTSRCNPVSHLCVGCTDNAQCEDGLLCNVDRGGVCHQCLSPSDCPAAFPACETSNGRCVECLNNAECRNADSARCETSATAGSARYTCVGCTDNADCSGGNRNLPGLCNTGTGICVDCIGDGDCSADPTRSRCGNGGVCAVCLLDNQCGNRFGGLEGCLANQGCVECTIDAHCANNPGTPTCKLSNAGAAAGDAPVNTCVECQDNNDCTSPTASRCVNNECVACAGNGDCAHLDTNGAAAAGGTLGICDVGTCVECTGPQRGACGTNVCNSRTRVCSNSLAGSAGTCATCVSDAQCEQDARCVQQVFGGTVIGDFCLPIPTAGSCNSVRPFVGLVTVATLDSATPTGVCTLRATTCPGLNDAAEPCDQDADCGAAGAADGLCVEFGGDNQCTTPCSSPNDCNGACDTSACAL